MNRKYFNTFEEACNFAKYLSKNKVWYKIIRNGDGPSRIIEYDDKNINYINCEIEILKKQIDEKESTIDKLKKQLARIKSEYLQNIQNLQKKNSFLQNEIDKIKLHIEEYVSKKCQEANTQIENQSLILSKQIEKSKQEESKFKESLRILRLIEKEYEKHYGHAEVIAVKEKIIDSKVCPNCNGSGGINGGCRKCDGKGWIETPEEITREIVKLE